MKTYSVLFFSLIIATGLACKKSVYLDAKPDQALIIPENIKDLQALLDNTGVMNGNGFGLTPSLAEIGADNYYMRQFPALSGTTFKELYLWEHVINRPGSADRLYEWDLPYKSVFYANVVLDGLDKINPPAAELNEYNLAKGSAIFFRAHIFYQLAQVFAPVYSSSTASKDPGIPLKLESDVNETVVRASVQQSYDFIIRELKEAAKLLPPTNIYKTRPSKTASYALLARVYQTLQMYDSSLVYSNKALALYDRLIDYNDNTIVNSAGVVGIRRQYNDEVIFHCSMIGLGVDGIMYAPTGTRGDTILYASYDANDMRKPVFFRVSNGPVFKGSYDASNRSLFTGLATDEVYLIRAECYARKNMITEAMNDLNTLLVKRWRKGFFVPLTAANANEALQIILRERRKELVFRGLRWTDIRRLNQEGENISVIRLLNGQLYTLKPSDTRFTWLIPDDVMLFNPDWPQNPR